MSSIKCKCYIVFNIVASDNVVIFENLHTDTMQDVDFQIRQSKIRKGLEFAIIYKKNENYESLENSTLDVNLYCKHNNKLFTSSELQDILSISYMGLKTFLKLIEKLGFKVYDHRYTSYKDYTQYIEDIYRMYNIDER